MLVAVAVGGHAQTRRLLQVRRCFRDALMRRAVRTAVQWKRPSPLHACKRLQELSLVATHGDRGWPSRDVQKLPQLTRLMIEGDGSSRALRSLHAPALCCLVIIRDGQLEDTSAIARVATLTRLELHVCAELRSRAPLSRLTVLHTLVLQGVKRAPEPLALRAVSRISSLRRLEMRFVGCFQWPMVYQFMGWDV